MLSMADSASQDGDRQSPTTSNFFKGKPLGKIDYCAFCSKKEGLQPCLFCGAAAYCCPEHQQFDWKRHKMMCKILQARGLVQSNMSSSMEDVASSSSGSTSSNDVRSLFTGGYTSAIPTGIKGSSVPIYVRPAHAKFNIMTSNDESHISRSVPGGFQPFTIGQSSAFKPYREAVTNSFSSDSVSSWNGTTGETSSFERMSSPALLGSAGTANPMGHQMTPPSSSRSDGQFADRVIKSEVNDETIILTDDPDIQIIEGGSSSGKIPARPRKRPTPSNSAEPKVQFKDHNKNVVYSTTLQEHQRHLQNRGLALNLHQAMVLRLRYIAEHAIRSLNEFGWAVVDNFLGSDHYKYTALEIEKLYHRGLFSAGQLMEGKHKDEHHIQDIRSDKIYWYDGADERASDAATVRLLISMIDSVIQHFKKRISHDIGGRSRAMIAIYPGSGTRYVKHVDNPVKDGRCITTIYYCNENWDMNKDGGTLRLYPETSMTPMDIDPRADRLVFFWSDRRNPHEVMPVFRHRFAITIWYMDKEERSKALSRGKENPQQNKDAEENMAVDVQNRELAAHVPPKKDSSTHELSKVELRLFPTTSSEPSLIRTNSKEDEDDKVSVGSDVQPTFDAQESTDSGVGSVNSHTTPHNVAASIPRSESFRSRTTARRSSSSSDGDIDDLPPPPADNPEYII